MVLFADSQVVKLSSATPMYRIRPPYAIDGYFLEIHWHDHLRLAFWMVTGLE